MGDTRDINKGVYISDATIARGVELAWSRNLSQGNLLSGVLASSRLLDGLWFLYVLCIHLFLVHK